MCAGREEKGESEEEMPNEALVLSLLEFDVEEGPRKGKTLKSTNSKRQHLLMNWIRLRLSYKFAITSINTLHFS